MSAGRYSLPNRDPCRHFHESDSRNGGVVFPKILRITPNATISSCNFEWYSHFDYPPQVSNCHGQENDRTKYARFQTNTHERSLKYA